MQVATHPGTFHADDVFAVAVLSLVHDELRSCARATTRGSPPPTCGSISAAARDPSTGDFDHHQRGGAGERANGIRYASFGLVWREFGAQLAGGQDAAEAIDQRLVQGVDANDTGQNISTALIDGIRPMTVSGVIAAMNPAWDEALTEAEEDARFAEAVALAARSSSASWPARAPTGVRWTWCAPRSSAPPTRASSSSTASCRGTRPS